MKLSAIVLALSLLLLPPSGGEETAHVFRYAKTSGISRQNTHAFHQDNVAVQAVTAN